MQRQLRARAIVHRAAAAEPRGRVRLAVAAALRAVALCGGVLLVCALWPLRRKLYAQLLLAAGQQPPPLLLPTGSPAALLSSALTLAALAVGLA
eukprot:5510680-Prymnesium_polylepis.1